MSKGINKVILIGNLGADPELRTFPNGGAVANVTLATSETWKDKQGDRQERTDWHNVVFHNKLAEIASQYLRKGSKVYVEGKLRTEKWQDKTTGQDRYTTKIHAEEMQMLDGKPADSQPRSSAASGGDYAKATGRDSGARRAPPPAADPGFEDDDIPF